MDWETPNLWRTIVVCHEHERELVVLYQRWEMFSRSRHAGAGGRNATQPSKRFADCIVLIPQATARDAMVTFPPQAAFQPGRPSGASVRFLH